MPSRPKRPCRQLGCPALVVSGYCAAHQREAQTRRNAKPRESSTQRGYDYTWQRFTAWYKIEYPLCKPCEDEGSVSPTYCPHHIKPLKDYPELKYVLSNLMPVCFQHHERLEGRRR
ncbi:MAG: HNH endonuclease signature motif containing protein [Armatimonadota bacterium]